MWKNFSCKAVKLKDVMKTGEKPEMEHWNSDGSSKFHIWKACADQVKFQECGDMLRPICAVLRGLLMSFWHSVPQVALVVKTLPEGDIKGASWIPGLGKSPRGGHGNSLQYSCLENPMDREAWLATVHRGRKESDTTEATWHACTHIPRRKWQ